MDAKYSGKALPAGVRSRSVNANGITLHLLETGYESTGRPLVMLIHGFPELAYSWREQLPPLAEAGFHAVAIDLRGYGLSWGTNVKYEDDLSPYAMPNHVADIVSVVHALGYSSAAAVIGHDFGSSVAAWCALIRPDVFGSLVMMSAPFSGPPVLPSGKSNDIGAASVPPASVPPASVPPAPDIHAQLAALPRPRKHYQRYYTTREANENMWHCPQGIHAFLRAYYHYKSADWKENKPFRLESWSAAQLAKMPTYYIMDFDEGMAETAAAAMPSSSGIESCHWLTEEELSVYSSEYARNSFQGGLQNYRIRADERFSAQLRVFAGRTIDVPSCFISGACDWGTYQRPGAVEAMANEVCTQFSGIHLVEGAGHWVQQEQPERVNALLVDFLRDNKVK